MSEDRGVPDTIRNIGFCCEDAARRFWAKVDKTDGCWTWIASQSLGYGRFTQHGGGTTHMAHRLAYEALRGSIPEGRQLDHLCRVRNCVRPDHLEPVTPRENTMRSPIAPASVNAARTHCSSGHELNDANTYRRIRPGGGRACRVCLREVMRLRRAAERAA